MESSKSRRIIYLYEKVPIYSSFAGGDDEKKLVLLHKVEYSLDYAC